MKVRHVLAKSEREATLLPAAHGRALVVAGEPREDWDTWQWEIVQATAQEKQALAAAGYKLAEAPGVEDDAYSLLRWAVGVLDRVDNGGQLAPVMQGGDWQKLEAARALADKKDPMAPHRLMWCTVVATAVEAAKRRPR
jgi:hypothetical protein